MFRVKWVERFNEHQPIAIEDSVLTDLDRIFVSCKERLPGKKFKQFGPTPDGFILCDEDGAELRRWINVNLESRAAIVATKESAWLPSRWRHRRTSQREILENACDHIAGPLPDGLTSGPH
jgi:hypothetical protein